MSIQYDFFETPQPNSRKKHTRYHARIVNSDTVTTKQLAKFINECCSVTTADVKTVLDALVHVMEYEMRKGNQIHLDDLGYFKLTLSCPPVKSTREIQAESIKLKSIAFRPEIALKKRFSHLTLEKTNDDRHSKKYSDSEIEQRLTNYFQDNPHITCKGFQKLCGLLQATAYRKLDALVKDGKLRKGGYPQQILYTPIEGNYGY